MRFWNNEVLNNTDAVIGRVLEAVSNPAYPSPGTPFRGAPPSPTREEGKDNHEFGAKTEADDSNSIGL